MCNSPEFVAAAKGGKPVFGTNPLAVGIPQKGCVPFTVRYFRLIVFVFVWLVPYWLIDSLETGQGHII
jgi:hypothetical protein